MKYHLLTLGCQMNESDTERVRTVIDRLGYSWTPDEQAADLLGVIACSVRQKAIDRVYTRIHRWNGWKRDRNVLTFVSGCILPSDRGKFLKLFDLVFTMNELPELPAMLRQYGVVTPLSVQSPQESGAVSTAAAPAPAAPVRPSGVIPVDALLQRPARRGANRPVMDGLWRVAATPASAFEAFVPIQNGCDKFCTFCAVPYTRGREVSRPSADILGEVESLVARGFKSITLLGQNVNSYGRDRAGEECSFAELLEAIGRFGARAGRPFWVYFTSPHPRDMTVDVLETMARHPCLARQVHLPLQSGDDQVLLSMNRQHSVAQYRAIVAEARRLLPDATLFTDIIVGFSGETEAQFENTHRLMDEVGYNMAFLSMYSPRPGAASSRWPDDVPLDEKKRRFHVLNECLKRHAADANQRLVGRTARVLVTGRDAELGCLTGVTEGKTNVRIAVDRPEWVGQFADVTVTSATVFSIAAEPAGSDAAACLAGGATAGGGAPS